MKKGALVLVVLITAAVLIGARFWYGKTHQTTPQNTPPPSPATTPVVKEASSTTARAPINTFGDNHSYFDLFTNTSTGATVSLKEVPLTPAEAPASGNMPLGVFLNKKKIGEIWVGPAGSEFGFSPDNTYFGWETRWDLGCCSFGNAIDIVNIASGTIISIAAPRPNPQSSGLIESYIWDQDAINFTFFSVQMKDDQQYYQVSPKQIWHYDFTTKSATLVRTL